MHFLKPPVWICGEGPIAGRIREELTREGRRVRMAEPQRIARLRPWDCRTLVLIDSPGTAGIIHRLKTRLAEWRQDTDPLRVILVHSASPPPADLADLDAQDPLRLETFALEDRAARALLARWPLHFGMDPRFDQRPHLLIAGFAPPARAFLLQALRLIHYGEERARVTVACEDAETVAEHFARAYPQAERVAEIRWSPLDPLGPLQLGPESPTSPPVTQVLVCPHPPSLGVDLARRLAKGLAQLQHVSPPILLEIGEAEPRGRIDDWDGQTFPFSYLREACRPQVLLDGEGDRLAQAIHEHYTDSIAAQGRDPGKEPAGQPWPRLAGTYRDANRRQADHLGAKLAVTDCRAVAEERVESFAFAPLEAERLSVIEHLRWAADRYLDGWTYAPKRDNVLKHHPQLIPYQNLSGPMKDLDRYAVRGVPALLARSGLGVVRSLILGLPEPAPDCLHGAGLQRLADRALARLVARFPDRALVVASSLADPRARLVVRRALERANAGLYLLLPQPIGTLLSGQTDNRARRELLELAAHAERRISLGGAAQVDRWLADRADIIMSLGPQSPSMQARKRVQLDPGRHALEWNFEY